jgi:hypothetical protein
MKIKCPICGCEAEELAEEVDIGVGVQRFVTGLDCSACGLIPNCDCCGVLLREGATHYPWCQLSKGIRD